MAKLHVLEQTELSEYCLNILEKHDIRLAREFISEKPEKLMKILNLNFEQIKKIKKELIRLYGPSTNTLYDRMEAEQDLRKVYATQISTLDELLGEKHTLHNLSFWEICGATGVGKTQLAFSLMLNFVVNHKLMALYLDTKLDFSAGRIKNMLKSRKTNAEMIAGIMSSIKVERVLSAQGVVEMMEHLYKQLKQANPDVMAIKLIILDSLPAVWFLLKADLNRLPGKWLLSRLSQIIHRLVQDFYITIICVNLSLLPSLEENQTKNTLAANQENDISDLIEADDMDMENKTPTQALDYRPCLGHCWLSKPHIRLSMELPNHDVEDSSLRIIKIIKSSHTQENIKCLVRIQDEGVVAAEL